MRVTFFLFKRIVEIHLSYCGCKGSMLIQAAQYSKTGKATIPTFRYRAASRYSSHHHSDYSAGYPFCCANVCYKLIF